MSLVLLSLFADTESKKVLFYWYSVDFANK